MLCAFAATFPCGEERFPIPFPRLLLVNLRVCELPLFAACKVQSSRKGETQKKHMLLGAGRKKQETSLHRPPCFYPSPLLPLYAAVILRPRRASSSRARAELVWPALFFFRSVDLARPSFRRFSRPFAPRVPRALNMRRRPHLAINSATERSATNAPPLSLFLETKMRLCRVGASANVFSSKY